MLHTHLERQIKFIRQELKDEVLDTVERIQLENKLNNLITKFNGLAQRASTLDWRMY